MIWNLHIVPTDIYVSYLCFILLVYHTRIVEISNVPTYSDDPNKSSELFRGVGTEPEFRGFSTEKFLTSWIYEGGNFLCFTGKKLVPTPLLIRMIPVKSGMHFLSKGFLYEEIHHSMKIRATCLLFVCNIINWCRNFKNTLQ